MKTAMCLRLWHNWKRFGDDPEKFQAFANAAR
jgi:hypothetical protein